MLNNKRIGVVVPAFNEEKQIGMVLERMPDFVDAIIVVDDASRDKTAQIVESKQKQNDKIVLIKHEKNSGVGAAIASGYIYARDHAIDVAAVMAGDGQMDPIDLERVIKPVVSELADYCKGNRFQHVGGFKHVPRIRFSGNFILSTLTKIVSGYWHVSDTQCGYTAINRFALNAINLNGLYPSYGFPNDLLVKINIADMRVVEVPVDPLYNIGETSKMRIHRIIFPISRLLLKDFVLRLITKYLIKSGHPVIFSYFFSAFFFLFTIGLGIYLLVKFIALGLLMKSALIVAGVSFVVSIQLLLSAFQMDSEANRHICIYLNSTQIRSLNESDRN